MSVMLGGCGCWEKSGISVQEWVFSIGRNRTSPRITRGEGQYSVTPREKRGRTKKEDFLKMANLSDLDGVGKGGGGSI